MRQPSRSSGSYPVRYQEFTGPHTYYLLAPGNLRRCPVAPDRSAERCLALMMTQTLFLDYRQMETIEGFTRKLEPPRKHSAEPLMTSARMSLIRRSFTMVQDP